SKSAADCCRAIPAPKLNCGLFILNSSVCRSVKGVGQALRSLIKRLGIACCDNGISDFADLKENGRRIFARRCRRLDDIERAGTDREQRDLTKILRLRRKLAARPELGWKQLYIRHAPVLGQRWH